ncbi:glycosyl hydrolase [Marinoscillum sp.]|uniref:glycosyl hydrolase n=1 Tax=Marinoscillum sp. TaxID=2024838 RepID=UPI003BAAEC68
MKWLFFLCLLSTFLRLDAQKRGLGYGHHTGSDLRAISSGVSWWYNWYHLPDAGVRANYQDFNVQFVPMAWNGAFDRDGLYDFLTNNPQIDYLLGFNEPNFTDQANMTPSEAAAVWPELEALADEFNLKLVGPAVNFCGDCVSENGVNYSDPVEYLDAFFDECVDCRVDYIAVHWYGCGGLEWYLDLFKKYDRPLWVTEIACWDQENISLDQQKRFLIDAVELMENDPNVFRYAWFTGRGNGPHISILGSTGQLTELGELYVNMPVHDTTQYLQLPAKIEAENYQKTDGAQLELTTDTDGLIQLSHLDVGDWVEYQVDVQSSRSFTFDLRYAANRSGKLSITVDDKSTFTIDLLSTGGWGKWRTLPSEIELSTGEHVIRLEVLQSGFNLNWIAILEERPPVLSSPEIADLAVYPNPSSKAIRLVPGHFEVRNTLVITAIDGREVLRQTDCERADLQQIDISSWQPGIYIAIFSVSGSSPQVSKFIRTTY